MNIWIKKIIDNKIFCLLLTLNILLVMFFLFAPQFAPNSPIEIHADHALLDSSGQYPWERISLADVFCQGSYMAGSHPY